MPSLKFDVEAAKEQLTQLFRDRITAQGAAYNVLNVNLADVTFAGLQQKIANQDALVAELKDELATARANCETWFNDVQPQLTVVPQAAINYGTLWNAAIPLALEQLKTLTPDRTLLAQLFGGLRSSADAQATTLGGLLTAARALRGKIAADAANFSTNHAPFQQLEDLDKENLAAARMTLDEIKLMIAAYSEEIAVDTITADGDLAIASYAMKYGAKFGDPGKAMAVTIGLIFIVSATKAIDDLLAAVDQRLAAAEEAGEYQLEMTSLTVQLVSLDTASSALAALVKELDDVIATLQACIVGWTSDRDALQAVVDGLQGDQPVNLVISLFDLGETQADWDDLAAFATTWQAMDVSPKAHNELVLNPPVVAAAGAGS